MLTLSTLFGQEAAVKALRRALEADALAGTYLIIGQDGVGKGTVAQAFANAAACLNPTLHPFDACGQCDSCRRTAQNQHPEIVNVYPAGDQMQIWQFWDRDNKPSGVLSRTLSFAPVVGKRRVFILHQADRLNESAANSLLKVLEEPPPYVVMVLLAPHPARMLPTILSRSQMIRINSVPTDELATFLQDSHGCQPSQAQTLAAFAEGRIGQAVRLAKNPKISEEIALVMDYAQGLPNAPIVRALRAAEGLRKIAAQMKATVSDDEIEENETAKENDESAAKEKVNRKQYAMVFELLVTFYRDLLALSTGLTTSQAVVNRDRLELLQTLAQFGTTERWLGCLDAILLARRRLDANANIPLVTESLLMRLLSR